MSLSLTLPVSFSDGLSLDPEVARSIGEELSSTYLDAQPFPHIAINDFLPDGLADGLLCNFPIQKSSGDRIFEGGYSGHFKRQIHPETCSSQVREIFRFFNSGPFIAFVEGVTGIKGLIGDPTFEGGGFHETSTGGKLGIHADFRIHQELHLQRRVNILIYLNRDWRDEYRGELELWDRKMRAKVVSIAPVFNRCVIFNTDQDSFHGHPDALATPAEITRRSAALYYYTASPRIYDEIRADSTMYRPRPDEKGRARVEALRARTLSHLRDWTPPAAFRLLQRRRVSRRNSFD